MTTTPNPEAKMVYLIKRRPDTSREALIAHWYANHMPGVIAGQSAAAERGELHATRYIATLFDPDRDGDQRWDGMAQLWWERPPPDPDVPHGTQPRDTFQQKAEPYVPWATTEYVVLDGSDRLPVEPLTLDPPFPTTRSGFCKITFLVTAKPDADHAAFFDHWLDTHATNVRTVMERFGGWRYVISHSRAPADGPYVGMAELYFDDVDDWKRFATTIEPDGMERWSDGSVILRSGTEMIGIP